MQKKEEITDVPVLMMGQKVGKSLPQAYQSL